MAGFNDPFPWSLETQALVYTTWHYHYSLGKYLTHCHSFYCRDTLACTLELYPYVGHEAFLLCGNISALVDLGGED